MTIKEFNQLATQRYAKQHPAVPPHAIPPAKYSDKNTNELTKSIIAFIEYQGGQAERISVEGRVIDKRKTFTDVLGRTRTVGNVQRVWSSGKKGSADISCTYAGRSIKIEVKFGKDRLRPEQIEYAESVRAAGGIYIVAKTFEQFTSDWDSIT